MSDRVIVAQYPGTCGSCDEPFPAGASILPLDSGGWAHLRCPDPLALRPGEATCTTCWLVHPAGACDA